MKETLQIFEEAVERMAKYEVALRALFILRNNPEKLESYLESILESIIEKNNPVKDGNI